MGAILLTNASPYLSQGTFSENYLNGIEITRLDWYNDYWDAAGIAYHLTGDLTVARGNSLRLAPGTVIKCAERTQIKVMGTFEAVGTASKPIILTSIKDDSALGDTNGDGSATTPQAKDWGGIYFDHESRDNPGAVGYAELRYTGQSIYPNVAPIELDNVSPSLHHITFVDNFISGVRLTAERNELDSLVLGSTDVPYLMLDDLQVPIGNVLVVQPGVVLKFTLNKSLHVYGVLQAVGAPLQRITMTSLKDDQAMGDTNNDGQLTSPARGNWGCVSFKDESIDALCAMEWVDLRYGGSDGLEFGSRIGGIRFEDTASPRIANVDMTSNWINAIEIPEGDWQSDTWDNTDMVYFVSDNLRIPQGKTLTISPGIVVKVANFDAPTDPPKITVEGGLRVGVADQARVYFTSGYDDSVGPANGSNADTNDDGTRTAPAVHDWIGILFSPTADAGNGHLHSTVFRYAGTRASTFYDPHAAVRFEGVGLPVVACEFSWNYRGIEAIGGSQPAISWTTFEDNEDYAVYNDGPGTTVQATNCWWGSPTGPGSDGEPGNTATGFGEKISTGVMFDPWLTVRP